MGRSISTSALCVVVSFYLKKQCRSSGKTRIEWRLRDGNDMARETRMTSFICMRAGGGWEWLRLAWDEEREWGGGDLRALRILRSRQVQSINQMGKRPESLLQFEPPARAPVLKLLHRIRLFLRPTWNKWWPLQTSWLAWFSQPSQTGWRDEHTYKKK